MTLCHTTSLYLSTTALYHTATLCSTMLSKFLASSIFWQVVDRVWFAAAAQGRLDHHLEGITYAPDGIGRN